jgi:hypothetical protein
VDKNLLKGCYNKQAKGGKKKGERRRRKRHEKKAECDEIKKYK